MTTNSEKALLSQLMRDKDIYFKTSLKREYFTDNANVLVFTAIEKCINELKIIPDIMAVREILPDVPMTELLDISEYAQTTQNWKHYHQEVVEAYRKKTVRRLLTMAVAEIEQKSTDAIITDIESGITDLFQNVDRSEINKINHYAMEYMEKLEERFKNKGELVGLPFPWDSSNDLTLGLQPRRLYIVGARPSQGKTAEGIQIVTNLAMKGHKVGMLSLESSAKEVLNRMVSTQSKVDLDYLTSGKLQHRDFDRITHAMGPIYDANLFICDKPNMTLTEVLTQGRRMVLTEGVKFLLIDYAQIIDAENPSLPFHEQMKVVSKSIKQLARQLEIPIMLLVQLRRDSENKRPRMADIADCSQFEKDADVIQFIYHEKEGDETKQTWFIYEKQRDGRTGALPMYFDGPHVCFREPSNYKE